MSKEATARSAISAERAMKLALEALEGADWYINQLEMIVYSADDAGTHENRLKVQQAITVMRLEIDAQNMASKPAQQEPLQNNPFDCGVYLGSGKDYAIKHHVSYGPAQQEPVAWTNWRELVGARHYRTPGWEMYADKRNPDDVAIYTSPPAQRTWVSLTDEEITDIWAESSPYYHEDDFARAIEAKLKAKNFA